MAGIAGQSLLFHKKTTYLARVMEANLIFPKSEKLGSKKCIDTLFANGRWLRSKHLRLVYFLSENEDDIPVQIVFSVPKRFHRRAVKRNLLKRRLRESYRLNKPAFYKRIEGCLQKIYIGVVFSTPDVVEYAVIDSELKYLLLQLSSRISQQKS